MGRVSGGIRCPLHCWAPELLMPADLAGDPTPAIGVKVGMSASAKCALGMVGPVMTVITH